MRAYRQARVHRFASFYRVFERFLGFLSTHHQVLDLVDQRRRREEVVDGREQFGLEFGHCGDCVVHWFSEGNLQKQTVAVKQMSISREPQELPTI